MIRPIVFDFDAVFTNGNINIGLENLVSYELYIIYY